jgi:hypothetical protein
MNCLELIRKAQKQGQQIAEQDGKLVVTDPDSLPPDLREQLKQLRDPIVELLRSIAIALRRRYTGPWLAIEEGLGEVEFDCTQEEFQTLTGWVLESQENAARDWCMRRVNRYFEVYPHLSHRQAGIASILDLLESQGALNKPSSGNRRLWLEVIARQAVGLFPITTAGKGSA